MEIKKTYKKKIYKRNVEGMGEGLVLLKVSLKNPWIGQRYHLFYEDTRKPPRKPPLDIAINPQDGMIEYVSYFIMNEMINEDDKFTRNITKESERISILCNQFNENNVHIRFKQEFKSIKSKNDIWIIKDNTKEKIISYDIDDSNSILFEKNEFCGLILHNLQNDEIEQLYISKCLRL